MLNFFKKSNDPRKENLNSLEYETCLKRISELDTKIRSFEGEFKIMQTSLDNLRGNFNRKLRGIKEEETKEEQKPTETIIKDEFVAFG
jgi:hypothetical protein